ncbi:PAS domain S-box-containing protein [Kaistia hirudinis]|uniref:C4-dicarboxylate transport sensor protein DctB n=1 Tax=Kaistia hirudinis TaxID=1293440 RepID=A0A840ASU4_9HYPH|nr:ATP-binding protein [Kaistia hirudinis]MBB3933329.1 PAS domain S-box-containing protein [Kaistia hirudinis]
MSATASRAAAAVLAVAIFLFDLLSPLEGAVAVLYVLVILLAARTGHRRDILVAAAVAFALTLSAYGVSHGFEHAGAATLRAIVSLAAIGIATMLALQNQAATGRLVAQAQLLDLSHDMIFVRDATGVIIFWNNAAQEIYGWSFEEAIGRVADELLQTRYPDDRAAIESTLFETGRWDGTLEQSTRSGARLVVESRWALRRDALGRPIGVLETHTDVTERRAAYAALVRSERRYRRMFDASRIGVVQEDWNGVGAALAALPLAEGQTLEAYLVAHPEFMAEARGLTPIVDVNPAFLSMVGAGSASEFIETVDDVLSERDDTFARALAAFARGESFYEGETEIVHIDGRRVPVIFAITFPKPDDPDSNALVFVVDITERKEAQEAVLAAQAELAHAARVATLGELTASIAHEVNQPLMAVVTNGEAAMRWMRREPPDLVEVEASITRLVAEGRRASEIVKRVRAFLRKAPEQRDELDIADLVAEAVQLVERELARAGVTPGIAVAPGLPAVIGDRIQLQQVLVNLMVNAAQAMADHPGERRLSIEAALASADMITITVADTGPGIAADHLERLFDPFFTTKEQGMGMGLAICRTTAEAHGGALSVESRPGGGATFRLSLPAPPAGASA